RTREDGAWASGLCHGRPGTDPSGRRADTTGSLGLLSSVAAARSQALAGLAPNFFLSAEYRGNLVLNAYQAILRRPAGNNEVQAWVNLINNGQATEEAMTATLVGSVEYFNNPSLGNADNATWLNQAYKDILGHDDSTDPNAASYLAQLNAASPANA